MYTDNKRPKTKTTAYKAIIPLHINKNNKDIRRTVQVIKK